MSTEAPTITMPNKPQFDRFRLLVFLVYIVVTLVTFMLSLWSVGFDFALVKWERLISDLLINWAITLLLMYVASKDGDLYFKSSPKYAFLHNLDLLVNRTWNLVRRGLVFAFEGYSHKKYLERLDGEFLKQLQRCGLRDMKILELNTDQIKDLLERPAIYTIKGEEVAFDILRPEQYLVVEKLKTGKYKYDEIPPEWFLSEYTDRSSDQYTYYSRAADHRARVKRLRVMYRLIMLLLISAMVAAWVVDEEKALTAQSWINAIARFGTAIMAIISGYISAKDDVQEQAMELLYKYSFIDGFFSDFNSGAYEPPNLTDVVREKLKKLELEAQEEDKKSEID